MSGVVTKKDWWLVAREFGWRAALRLLCSKDKVALHLLVTI